MEPTPTVAIADLARARLARELRSLPPWGSPALLARLLAPPMDTRDGAIAGGMNTATPGGATEDATPATGIYAPQASSSVSLGALVHVIRRAQRVGATRLAADLFVALLERIEGISEQWARRAVASARVDRALAAAVREDLRQELTLRLWECVGRGDSESWELFFQRALAFEQRHVAQLFLTRHGYWRDPRSQAPSRGVSVLLSRLTGTLTSASAPGQATDLSTLVRAAAGARAAGGASAEIADDHDPFTVADLADLRLLVERLPDRERQAVMLRFWHGASEVEIGAALGGVTTRTVRNVLSSAYVRLRGDYQPDHPNRPDQPTMGVAGHRGQRQLVEDVQ